MLQKFLGGMEQANMILQPNSFAKCKRGRSGDGSLLPCFRPLDGTRNVSNSYVGLRDVRNSGIAAKTILPVIESFILPLLNSKSNALIQGKLWTTTSIFLALKLVFLVVEVAFCAWVIQGERQGVGLGRRLLQGLVMLAAGCAVVTAAPVVHLVGKIYHHESIERRLSDHLGDYVPLKAIDARIHRTLE